MEAARDKRTPLRGLPSLTGIFLGTFFLALFSALLLTRWVRDFAIAHGWVAVPTHERHLHSTPLPRLGGVAIFLSTSLCMGTVAIWSVRHPLAHSPSFLSALFTIAVPASLVFLLGVYDDLRGAGPYFKFAVQGIAAAMLYA